MGRNTGLESETRTGDGKGATIQEFVATIADKTLEIDVAPWGEGRLKVNGNEIAHINDAKDRRQAFSKLAKAATATYRKRNSTRKQKALIHDSRRQSQTPRRQKRPHRRHRQRAVDRLGLRQGVPGLRRRRLP